MMNIRRLSIKDRQTRPKKEPRANSVLLPRDLAQDLVINLLKTPLVGQKPTLLLKWVVNICKIRFSPHARPGI